MTRFSGWRFASGLANLALLLIVETATAQPGSRPNLILIVTDDQQWTTIDSMPKLQTYFAQQGVKFTNAFATTALCSPSRASILTGQYAHHHGVQSNSGSNGGFSAFNDASTLATWLQAAGYRNGFYGKYLNGYSGTYIPPGWNDWRVILTPEAYFDYDLSENGAIFSYADADSDYTTDVLAKKAVNFINAGNGAPFFLCFAPNAPHEPATGAPRHASLFKNTPLWRPPSYNETDVSDKPTWLQNWPLLTSAQQNFNDIFRRKQYRALQAVDDAIEDMINAVDAIGATQNTIIIFMGDNGMMWGEHRLEDKSYAFEETIRVPLLIRAPGLVTGPREENRLVLNIDIAPTLAEYAGVIPPAARDGNSLVSVVNSTASTWRTDFWIENWEKIKNGNIVPEHLGVREANWKYIEYIDGDKELYDLVNDPGELTSRANDPAYAATQLQLATRLQDLKNSRGCTATPIAAFTSTPVFGFPPLTVNFTEQSTNFPTGWIWNFGDGGTSTAQNPSHQYTTPGKYTVTLTASNTCGNDSETKSNHITVCPPAPAAAFTATPTSGNVPLTVNFTDQSTNFPVGWSWNFGDGGTSSAQNPSRTYTTPGTYTVTLTASSSCGNVSLVKTNYITVNCVQPPTAAFTATPTAGMAPLNVNFTDNSTNFPTGWSWNFGDGGTSSVKNPSHQYTTSGTYTVTLTASNSCGSNSKTMTNYVTICASPPAAAFTATPTSGNVPLTVNFTDQSTNMPTGWSWNFGDGGTSSVKNPSRTYTTPGTYTVRLTASNNCGSNTKTMTNYITVNCMLPPTAAFTATPTSGTAPLTVNFTDQSTNFPTVWSWNFGDGGTSSAQNPSYQYTTPGTYSVTLTASNGCGNASITRTNYITVCTSPAAAFSATPTSGTAPLAVNFTDKSTNSPTAWSWNFGDGGTASTQNPSRTYTTPGTYSVTLTASNACGSANLTKANYIIVNAGQVDLTLNKTATASGSASSNPPGKAIDDKTSSWWQSLNLSSGTIVWWSVDLGATFNVNNVVIHWRNSYYATAYQIQTSPDGTAWTTNYTDSKGNGGSDNVTFIPTVGTARHVRIYMTKNKSSTEQIKEVEVYAATGSLAKASEVAKSEVITDCGLEQNYPNPFNPATQISYSVPSAVHVSLKVYNLTGEEIATLVNEVCEAGNHTATFEASRLTSGIYFAVLQAGEVRQVRRLVYMK